MVELCFRTRQDLDQAIVQIRSSNYQVQAAVDARMNPAWMAVKKTEAERRPTRVLRRAASTIQSCLEARKMDSTQVNSDPKTRTVSNGGMRICGLDRDSDVVWTDEGTRLLSTPDRNMVEASCATVP